MRTEILQKTEAKTTKHHDTSRTKSMEAVYQCRSCGGSCFKLIDLGMQPLANRLVASPNESIETFPLSVEICESCSLAQLCFCVDKEILYSDYNYITPDSEELKAHYADVYEFLNEQDFINNESRVLDIGSNIGRLLSFLKPHVASVLGIDPAKNVVDMAIDYEVPTFCRFFNEESAREVAEFSGKKDVIFARHCFAHNDDPGQILSGIPEILAEEGVLVIENAYFGDTIAKGEFDQVYHEHMYYYSLRGISGILENHDLKLVDVHHSAIHGGTMVFVAKPTKSSTQPSARVKKYLEAEAQMHRPEFYREFTDQIQKNRTDLRELLAKLNSEGKTVHAYGASAKATTLLNYYDITRREVPAIVDSTPTKIGKYVPGASIEIISEEDAFAGSPPDYYLLTIWNYRDEIIRKVRESGNTHTKFIMPHPTVEIV